MTKPGSTAKSKFVHEYAINASPKILYPYLSTAAGLSRWFSESVDVVEGNIYNFMWDKTDHFAEMTNHRSNRSVRFNFLDDDRKPVEDPDFVEFNLETSELTGEQYLRVTDYTADDDVEALEELWENLIQSLREIIGG